MKAAGKELCGNAETMFDYGIEKSEGDIVIALAGNPNVGKSTVFNALTGMKQHTGNWPGKTVANARGECDHNGQHCIMVDLPGAYSLMPVSAEEIVARDFICFGEPDVTIIVCDATCLERNLNLVLQTLEITDNVVVCVNLMDEARKNNIEVDKAQLSKMLGVPVVCTSARAGKGLDNLMDTVLSVVSEKYTASHENTLYSEAIEADIRKIEYSMENINIRKLSKRFVALKLLEGDALLIKDIECYCGVELHDFLSARKPDSTAFRDEAVKHIYARAREISERCVKVADKNYRGRQLRTDKLLTGKATGIPLMLLLLAGVFFITIVGANYPSSLLSNGLFWIQDRLTELLHALNAPEWFHGVFVTGAYRVMAWVTAVMLPPMAIFFPIFTLLEDVGYLPRIAFNLDNGFRKCNACGKQALTMCMGLGCNAVGVTGCRIIDSPRERLIAIITNSLVPCNGRFPTLIAIISIFFVGTGIAFADVALSAGILTITIMLGIFATLSMSKLLSATVLKGMPSSFALELPPLRKPQVLKVIVRSIFDRTLFVLGRAIAVAAPMGVLIYICANVSVDGVTILKHCTSFLDPFAKLMGLDGVILMAFILGFPANEIVVPLILMSYMASGSIIGYESLNELGAVLSNNGWTFSTAICMIIFSLFHWPCSTTLITIAKETRSLKWTLTAFIVPTLIGVLMCMAANGILCLVGLS